MKLKEKLKSAWFAFNCGKSADQLKIELSISGSVLSKFKKECIGRSVDSRFNEYTITTNSGDLFFSWRTVEYATEVKND